MLDVGTGTGVGVEAAKNVGATAVGVDRSIAMLTVGHRQRPDLPLLAGQVIDLPFRDRTFDVVMGNFVLAHFAKVETALFDVRRVLRPNGRVGFTSWSDGKDAFQDDLARARGERRPAGHARAGIRGRPPPATSASSSPQAIEETLRQAGFRQVRTERRRYQWTYAARRARRGVGHLDRGSLRAEHARGGPLGFADGSHARPSSRTDSPTR